MSDLRINQKTWDERSVIHFHSEFYNIPGFLRGECSLREIELAEMPDVRCKTLLHLQCHFGLDSLSWARRGALVTGVDFSRPALVRARWLRQKTRLNARFLHADVSQKLPRRTGEFDIVFTSYGVLCWLPELRTWAENIAGSLRKGGLFYMVEFHPLFEYLSGYAYFHSPSPLRSAETTYTENHAGRKQKTATWSHPVSEVINALTRAGLRLEFFNEFPFSPWPCFPSLEERQPGRFFPAGNEHDAPVTFSLTAVKD